MTATAKPFVKWAGGKRSLLPIMEPYVPSSFGRYFEPFVGGGALFFSLGDRSSNAVLVDTNCELITAYNMIKNNPTDLIKLLSSHAGKHSSDYYYEVRAHDPGSMSDLEIAARFIYLNKTCFNGLYRVNQKGQFNVPVGRQRNLQDIVTKDNIYACSASLRKCQISEGEFDSISPKRGDFVYLDPPYDTVHDRSFVQYDKNIFDRSDQERVRDFAADLSKQGVKVMLSNHDTPFIRDIYKDKKIFKINFLKAPRNINRSKIDEVLITTY